jgi:hypothetical protein
MSAKRLAALLASVDHERDVEATEMVAVDCFRTGDGRLIVRVPFGGEG